MKKNLSSFALIFLSFQFITAQNIPFRNYGTQRYMQQLKESSPSIVQNMIKIEGQESQFKKSHKNKKLGEYILPLVFHVLYNAKNDHATKTQIKEQVDALNIAFSSTSYKVKHKSDTAEKFINTISNTGLSFCLSSISPDGKNTDGYNEISTKVSKFAFGNDMKFTEKGGQNAWDTQSYINIWVVNLTDSISGFSQMPGGPSNTDGIVIDYRFFGINGFSLKPYNEGKTLVHLMANYLNVWDLWNESYECGDDYVEDTPIHNAPNHQTFPYRHVSTCFNYPVEMLTNYMDDTPDSIQTFFTYGQKERMHASIEPNGPRGLLLGTTVKCSNTSAVLLASRAAIHSIITVNIYPNPSIDNFTIEILSPTSKEGSCFIYNTQGIQIQTSVVPLINGKAELVVDSRLWSTGMYFVKLIIGEDTEIKKLILQR